MGMKVNDMKEEIRRRGVVPKGKKGDLQKTLKEIVEKQMPIIEGGPDKNAEALGGYPALIIFTWPQNSRCDLSNTKRK